MMKNKNIINIKYKTLNTILADRAGVTLLELMVAVSLFVVTILAASGIFESVINSQRQAIASQNLQENIRYSFEKISKDIRTAQKDKTHSCIPSGNVYWTDGPGTRLQFLNHDNKCICYYLNNFRIMVADGGCQASPINPLPLTPQIIKVSNLSFRLIDSGIHKQAFVTLKMRIEANVNGSEKETMDMQTTLSSRFYEQR